MSMYKIHRDADGNVKGYGPNVNEYQPLLVDGDIIEISNMPPSPSNGELFSRLRSERDTRINSVLWMRERHADELELGTETSLTPEQYTTLLTYIQALRDIPAQPGAPWDGGGELTPWPELPSVG